MAWGFLTYVYYLVLIWYFPSNLQPEAIINILQKKKITKAMASQHLAGVYHAMKQNPPKEKLVLKEYLVGGSALPKSLIEGFDKDFGIKGVQAWE
jgi:fatty-acyl-CoA synthase